MVLSLSALVLLVAVGLGIWFAFLRPSDDDNTTTSAGQSTATTAQDSLPVTTDAVAGPPAGATPCSPSLGRTGTFTSSAAGTTITSCPFAEEVRRAYAASGPPSSLPRSVDAASPVTGQVYTMTCTTNGKLATCTGGNNAVVYVY